MMGLLFAGIGALFLYIATRCTFFEIKIYRDVSKKLRFPIIGFIGYLLIFFFVAPYSIQFFGSSFMSMMVHSPALLMTIVQFVALAWVVTYLISYPFLLFAKTGSYWNGLDSS